MEDQLLYNSLFGEIDSNPDPVYKEYRRKWNENWKVNKVEDFPLFLDIEATSACNLKCPDCIQTIKKSSKGFMTLDLFRRIIDEASEHGCYGCKFHTIGRGEPLLHKEIAKMVAYAKKKGLVDVYLNTNGLLLDRKLCNDLIDAGLDRISFSIDHYDPKVYALQRVGSNLNAVIWNMIEFSMALGFKRKNTKIRVQAVDNKNLNKDEYVKYFMGYADEVGFIDYKDMTRREEFISDWKCSQLWQRMSILYDGSILPCNHDLNAYSNLGNINKGDTIGGVWRSKTMHYIRHLHMSGNAHFLASCNGCELRTVMVRKGN